MYKTSLFWFVVATATLSLICVAGAVVFWDWLHPAVPYKLGFAHFKPRRRVNPQVGGTGAAGDFPYIRFCVGQ